MTDIYNKYLQYLTIQKKKFIVQKHSNNNNNVTSSGQHNVLLQIMQRLSLHLWDDTLNISQQAND